MGEDSNSTVLVDEVVSYLSRLAETRYTYAIDKKDLWFLGNWKKHLETAGAV